MNEKLLEKARDGDQNALAQLLYENYEIVYKYLIKFAFDKQLSEDLVQETMVRAIVKIDYYDEKKSKFSTWLISIAQNIYIDYLRKKKVENRVASEIADLGICFDEDSISRTLDALSKLDDIIRFPLLLKHYYGYSYEEISKKMSIPLGTVKSRIHNGLKFLRKELGCDE